ncbi:uncharacterized protein LOC135950698 [Calliphora vicina]|uniref:uncharacterized protein LOC135950698 n=1 Tax=Calliphora vicina TaxID=7373 RepID=UPI00325BD7C7
MQRYGQTSADAVLATEKEEDLKTTVKKSVESMSISLKEEIMETLSNGMMEKMELMVQKFLHQLKPIHQGSAPQEQDNSVKELKSAPREPENAPRELESDPEKDPKEQTQQYEESGINNEKEEVTSNLLIQFRREIRKLEECLSDIKAENILILEHKKSSWEKIMVDIKQIHRELVVNHSVKCDIDEELELIDRQYAEAVTLVLMKIFTMQEEKKAVALETIKIPMFNGDVEEWCSFRNMFNRFVHMSKLPAVEKLVRLKTHVRGEALKIIQNLPITENNYIAAWEILNQRYGNKRILFTKLVDKILDQPSTNTMSASSLRNLLNITNESIQALKAMGVSLEDADPILARIIIRKLDKEGLMLCEQNTRKSKEIQILGDVMQFIELQCEALEASTTKKFNNMDNHKKQQFRATVLSTENSYCNYCKVSGHKIRECTKFIALTVENRNSWVRGGKICNICLNHRMDKRCFQKTKCQQCGKMHNTLLHINFVKSTGTAANNTVSSMSTHSPANVLLSTAQVKVQSLHGEYVVLRALIDHCSQVTTVSEEASQILALPRIKCRTEIQGLGGVIVGVSKSKIRLTMKPRFLSDRSVETDALILPQLTGAQPDHSFKFNINEWNNFVLADPSLNKSDRIDIVIGMDIITNIIEDGIYKRDGILAQSTIFGWILSGVIHKNENPRKVIVAVTNLERFWELEELPTNSEDYEEDKLCLDLFKETTEVDGDNRIVVNLPFKKDDNELGDSRKQALARLLSLERKLEANPKLKEDYHKFIWRK